MKLEDDYYIDPTQKDKTHIGLYCEEHPHMKYHTKNISPIGARSIFSNQSEGCGCPASKLKVIKE